MAFWTKDRELELIKLWDTGISASLIAERMGANSRNTILGKAWRMNLMQRRSGGAEKGVTNRITTRRKIMPKRPGKMNIDADATLQLERRVLGVGPRKSHSWASEMRDAVSEPVFEPTEYDVARISFDDLEPHHCKWICTPEPMAHHEPSFCGCKREEGQPYCAEHVRRATSSPGTPREANTGWKPRTSGVMLRRMTSSVNLFEDA